MLHYVCCQCGRFHYCIAILNEQGETVYFAKTVWHDGVPADTLETKLVERARKKGFEI